MEEWLLEAEKKYAEELNKTMSLTKSLIELFEHTIRSDNTIWDYWLNYLKVYDKEVIQQGKDAKYWRTKLEN